MFEKGQKVIAKSLVDNNNYDGVVKVVLKSGKIKVVYDIDGSWENLPADRVTSKKEKPKPKKEKPKPKKATNSKAMTKIGRSGAKVLGMEFKKAAEKLFVNYGLKVKLISSSYTDANVVFKLEVSIPGENRDAIAYKEIQEELGLPELGSTFTDDRKGKTFSVAGYKLRARTRPIIIIDQEGKEFVASVKAIKQYFK